MKAVVVENEKHYRVLPFSLGVSGLKFKSKAEAEQLASALNDAHERGRKQMQSDLRDLLGISEAPPT